MSTPRRIVSLLSSATEMFCALGASDRVVGVSHECDFPAEAAAKPRVTRSNVDSNADSRMIDDQVRSLLVAGRPLYEIDVGAISALHPDLIVTQSQCDVCAVRYEDVITAIESEPNLRGTPIIALNPRTLGDVLADIERVANAAGVGEIGKQVTRDLAARIDAVRARAIPLNRPRVACIEWPDPLMIAANWMPELVQFAGGEYGLARSGAHSEYGSWDDLIDYNPQVIVAMPCGFDLDRSWIESRRLAEQTGWMELEAVKTDRVFVADGSAYFNRPGPRLVESLELLACLLHPSHFSLPSSIVAARTVKRMPSAPCRDRDD